ncbi:uncharacterized protein LOC122092653 [Macadamia integrifolia]|uniref:uncharacterized protein LOC122092653 n=1 Tax=Macadamia integrifolia TaxID=60698 RepID=UPI001C528527|nr:uncharacterized protein LOC122092653 [Macadamia integrifolia]
MALRWLLHSVSAYAIGFSMDGNTNAVLSGETVRYPDEGYSHGSSSKGNRLIDLNEGNAKILKESYYGKSHTGFQMPLHYPRYKKADYENMEEWKVDQVLTEYGLISFKGTLEEKRAFATGAFLWPDQL